MRNNSALFLTLLIAFACCAPESQAAVQAGSAEPRQPVISEAEALIEEADLQLNLAKTGQYGRLKRGDMQRIETTHGTVVSLLAGVSEVSELSPQQRAQLQRAQSALADLLGADDPDRRVCKRAGKTGSRIGVMECLTVAEREARARASRNLTGDLQRGYCVQGAEGGSRCTH